MANIFTKEEIIMLDNVVKLYLIMVVVMILGSSAILYIATKDIKVDIPTNILKDDSVTLFVYRARDIANSIDPNNSVLSTESMGSKWVGLKPA